MSSFTSSKKNKPTLETSPNDGHEEKKSVGDLYDRLLDAEANKISKDDLTIHKRLKFPPEEQEKGIYDSNDWVRTYIDMPVTAHILDAGCGVGGTLFALLTEKRTGLGLTLSGKQLIVAQREAARRNLSDRCQFRQQSYDEPLDGMFDFILSIESLAHSYHLATSIQNLSDHLKPEGQLFLLEDMACSDLGDHKMAMIWQQSWCLQTIYTQHRYRSVLANAGLKIMQEVDLTSCVQDKPWPEGLVRFSWWLTQKMPASWWGTKDVFVGGWALESLYRAGLMKYQAFLVRKA